MREGGGDGGGGEGGGEGGGGGDGGGGGGGGGGFRLPQRAGAGSRKPFSFFLPPKWSQLGWC